MKNRCNRWLLLAFVLSLSAYAALLWQSVAGQFYPLPLWLVQLYPYLILGGHAIPAFCLQLLMCRTVQPRVLSALPLTLVVGAAAWCAVCFFTATGWDSLGWGILLLGCIAPALGCIAGLLVHRFSFKSQS